ncbi:MAG: polysaccharide biosynthesis protein, partial [bacterium]
TSMAQVLWYLPDSVGRILFPRVAASTREEANRLTPMVCRHTMFITAVACLSLWITGPWVVGLLYGEGFEASVQPMNLLLPGILASVLNRVLSKYLSGVGEPRLNSIASILSLVVNIPLLFFLVGALNVTGAAIATSLAYIVNGIVMLVFFVRVSGTSYRSCLVPSLEDLKIYPAAALQLWRRATGGGR